MESIGVRTESSRPLVAATAVAVGATLPVYLLGSLSGPLLRELDRGPAWLGWTSAGFFIAASAGASGSHRLTARLGDRRSLKLLAGLAIAASLAFALVPADPLLVATVLLLSGLVNGLSQPVVNAYLATRTAADRRGWVFAIRQSAIPGAALLAGAAVPVSAASLGWRWPVAAGALVPLLGLLLARPDPFSLDTEATDEPETQAPGWLLLALPTLVALGAGAAVSLGTFLIFTADQLGADEATAGYVVVASSGLCIAVRLLLGRLVDSRNWPPMRITAAMLAVGAAGYASISLVTGPGQLYALSPLLFAAGWGWVGLVTTAAVNAAPRDSARTTGAVQTGTYLGCAAGPALLGQLAHSYSVTSAWLVAAVCAGLAALVAHAIGRRLGQSA
ncbi:MFS transporter [Pseudonocardiaceae bacterium YIM PH 21723]|nr:MFS transporter [Pseudonocardiaceae bacterium YIM PH 21723]